MTPLQEMTELWLGIARLHRSTALVQNTERSKLQQKHLSVLADSLAGLLNCYSTALEEIGAELQP